MSAPYTVNEFALKIMTHMNNVDKLKRTHAVVNEEAILGHTDPEVIANTIFAQASEIAYVDSLTYKMLVELQHMKNEI
jgi:hypothetical protein